MTNLANFVPGSSPNWRQVKLVWGARSARTRRRRRRINSKPRPSLGATLSSGELQHKTPELLATFGPRISAMLWPVSCCMCLAACILPHVSCSQGAAQKWTSWARAGPKCLLRPRENKSTQTNSKNIVFSSRYVNSSNRYYIPTLLGYNSGPRASGRLSCRPAASVAPRHECCNLRVSVFVCVFVWVCLCVCHLGWAPAAVRSTGRRQSPFRNTLAHSSARRKAIYKCKNGIVCLEFKFYLAHHCRILMKRQRGSTRTRAQFLQLAWGSRGGASAAAQLSWSLALGGRPKMGPKHAGEWPARRETRTSEQTIVRKLSLTEKLARKTEKERRRHRERERERDTHRHKCRQRKWPANWARYLLALANSATVLRPMIMN